MSTIENGLRADVMRNKMESKDALQNAGDIYVGTGETIEITADGKTYEIPKTIGMNLAEAIVKHGKIDSYPLADALKPQLLNNFDFSDTKNKRTISFFTKDSSVNLGNNCIVPSNSEGIVVRGSNKEDGNGNITLYYSNASTSGIFFYNGSTWSSSIDLGSNDNPFKVAYANRYYIPNTAFNFQYNSDNEKITQINVAMGFNCIRPNGNTIPIRTFDFLDGQGEGGTIHDRAWIKAKGIVPYANNEINFDIQATGANTIVFGQSGSTQAIDDYRFFNGKNTNTYSDIYCKGLYTNTGINVGTNIEANNGYIQASYFNATSDKRLKENIIPFTPEKSILDLPIYTFNFKSDENKKKHVGCLAQDLQEICPDLVNEDSQGYLSIEESKITYLLLEEVKELKKQVEELKEKVNELEGK